MGAKSPNLLLGGLCIVLYACAGAYVVDERGNGRTWPGAPGGSWPGAPVHSPSPPPPRGPPPGYDYLMLAQYWPPSQVPVDAHSRARHLMHMQQASPGFWTHGLWPSRLNTKQPDYCTPELFKAEVLGVFEESLMYYLRSPLPTAQPPKLHSFWAHEWSRHGTCFGEGQLPYFFAVYQASSQINVYAALQLAGITPSNDKPYTKGQLQKALTARFGAAFGAQGLSCMRTATDDLAISSVRLCLGAGLDLVNCSQPPKLDEGWRPLSGPGDHGLSGGLNNYRIDAQEAAGLVPPGWAQPRGLAGWTALSGLSRPWRWRTGPEPADSGQWEGMLLGTRQELDTDTECPGGPETLILVPDWQDSPVARVPWDIVLGVGLLAAAVVAVLAFSHHLAERWQALPSLFVSRPIQVVHYSPVQQPVKVLCEPLDMEWMWTAVPAFAEFVDDLPVGMGIKGGIARKLLKEKCGTPEPPGSFDVDVLLFIDHYTNEARRAAREAVAGMRLGGLVLEPQDVEVLTKGYLRDYFITRDVTMNEVLILKTQEDTAFFFYTEDARRDAAASLIRPSVHCLKTEYHLAWSLEDNGAPYTASQQVCRSLVRYLKGHGKDYAFDKNTWAHYRKNKLTKTELFKVLKPFHDKDEKMQNAVDHLMSIGFLSRSDVRKAGGVNMLWGLLLQDLNKQIARHGGRLMLVELNPEAVERWVDHKKASVAAQLVTQEMRARRTGFAPSEENIVDLGGLIFPPELHAWIQNGQVFDLRAHLSRATDALIGELGSRPLPMPLQRANSLSEAPHLPEDGRSGWPVAAADAPTESGAAQAKSRWLAVKAAAASRGEAVWTLAMGTTSRTASQTNLDALVDRNSAGVGVGTSPTTTRKVLAAELESEVARLRAALNPQGDSRQGSQQQAAAHHDHLQRVRTLEELQEVSRAAGKRSNKGFKAMFSGLSSVFRGGATEEGGTAQASVPAAPAADQAPASSPAGPDKAAAVGSGTEGPEEEGTMRDEDVVRHSNLMERMPEQSVALPGTFYQVIGVHNEEESEYVPLVSNKEGPTRKRVEIVRLLRFLLGVMALEHRLLVGAYALLLMGLVARLCLPRIEAAIFDAFNDLDSNLFRTNLLLSMAYIGADITLSLLGQLTLETFARRAMRTTFRRFFTHVIFQDLPFFDKLSPGELMARTSGDSLTLRTLVCTTMYQVVEGCILFFGSLAFLTWSSDGMLGSKPGITVTFTLVVAANAIEGVLLGRLLRQLNLSVRQALGRMFGFTLDAFSRLDTVAALGLEPRMLADYKMFATDYFSNSFYLNAAMHAHRAFTLLLAATMRAALLWFGGAALFSDLTTVGTLFAMLRYVAWMQKGMRGTSNACMRLMAGMGSVERIVELHDRGVFGATPGPGASGGHAAGDSRSLDTEEGGMGQTPVERNLFHAPRTPQANSKAGQGLLQPLLSDDVGLRSDSQSALEGKGPRPDWSAMMGGVLLDDIHLTMRSRTDKLLLHDCSLTLMPGEACLLSGDEIESKSGLLALIMLRMVPYKGSISFQLPDHAIPPGCALGDTTHTAPGGPTPLAGGPGWKWVPFSFRLDDMRGVRECIAVASVRVAGVFRTSLEDNIAVAAPREVTNAEVREVSRRVGLYDIAMQLPDGFGTVVGEGSGHPLSQAALLKIVLARCLLRKPKILLVDDADAFSDALGPALLVEVLQDLSNKGCTLVIASKQAYRWPLVTKVFMLRNGMPTMP